jgi:hypothetical protein
MGNDTLTTSQLYFPPFIPLHVMAKIDHQVGINMDLVGYTFVSTSEILKSNRIHKGLQNTEI